MIAAEVLAADQVTTLAAHAPAPGLDDLANFVGSACAQQFGVELVNGVDLPESAAAAGSAGQWLAARHLRPQLDRRGIAWGQLGVLEVYLSLLGGAIADVLFAGDFIADSASIERLEQRLRGCRFERAAISAVVDAVYADPRSFLLGVGPLQTRGRHDSERGVERSMSRALLDGTPESRIAAMAALVARAAPPSRDELEALRDCLGDQRKPVQRRAAEAFAALSARGVHVEYLLRNVLDVRDLRARWGAAYALSLLQRLRFEALPTLFEVMALDDGDLRWAASELIKQLAAADGERVVAALLLAARDPGPQRKMALYCLRDLGVAESSDIALAALTDPHLDTRLAAVALLAKVHRDPSSAARRIAALVDDADPRMQRVAAATLGNLGVALPEVLAALDRAEASSDDSLRRAAARSRALLDRA